MLFRQREAGRNARGIRSMWHGVQAKDKQLHSAFAQSNIRDASLWLHIYSTIMSPAMAF